MNNGDDRDRPQMAGGNITRYRAFVARISCLSQDRPDLKFASMQVCCAMANPSVRHMERVKMIGRYFAGKSRAKCWFRWQQSWKRIQTLAGRRQSQSTIGVSRGNHERWTLLQGVDQEAASRVAVFRRERAVRRSQNSIRRIWDPERGKGLGTGLSQRKSARA